MQRVLRFLLVCFLAAAMPLKGMAVVSMRAGGSMPAAKFAHDVPGQAEDLGQRGFGGHVAPMAHMAHMAMARGAHTAHGARATPLRDLPAAHATHCEGFATDPGADMHKAPATAKCSACDACAAATPLPAQPPRVVAPECGPARFQPLALAPVCFVTDVPDRPPRHRLA